MQTPPGNLQLLPPPPELASPSLRIIRTFLVFEWAVDWAISDDWAS